MKYDLEYSSRARAGLDDLDSKPRRIVSDKIEWLAENAADYRHEPMTGQYSGMFRLRVGAYRAVYELDRINRRIFVDQVGHRRDVY